MDLLTFGVQLLNATQYGLVLFLVASGLTLVFGILGVINLAHGAFYMIGAYGAYWLSLKTGSFWLALVGIALYFIALSVGGWLQGEAMLDAQRPFMESVLLTLPYLKARSIGGGLMLASHLVFVAHFICVVLALGPNRRGAALLRRTSAAA